MHVERALELAGEPGDDVAGDILADGDAKPVRAFEVVATQVEVDALAHVLHEVGRALDGIDKSHPSTLPVS